VAGNGQQSAIIMEAIERMSGHQGGGSGAGAWYRDHHTSTNTQRHEAPRGRGGRINPTGSAGRWDRWTCFGGGGRGPRDQNAIASRSRGAAQVRIVEEVMRFSSLMDRISLLLACLLCGSLLQRRLQ